MAVVEIKNLSKVYVRDFFDVEHGRLKLRFKDRRIEALIDLTMEVEQGEIFGLLGPNGAGKTTALKILTGIHYASSGTAKIFGGRLDDPAVKKRIGFLPENPYFYDYLRGWEFLDFYGQLYGIPKARRRKKVEELLALVGLTHAENLPLRAYSKGMNQRIGVAQTLLNDPDLVFFDEPQSGLDPLGRKDIRDIILSLRDQGKTVFFSSHILQDAELVCDRVAVLNKGRLQAIGHLSELLSQKVEEWEVVISAVDKEFVDRMIPKMKKHIESKGEHLCILDQEDLANDLIRATLAKGGTLVSLTPRRQTLEDYFISEVAGGPK